VVEEINDPRSVLLISSHRILRFLSGCFSVVLSFIWKSGSCYRHEHAWLYQLHFSCCKKFRNNWLILVKVGVTVSLKIKLKLSLCLT